MAPYILVICPVTSRARGHRKDRVLLATAGCGDVWLTDWAPHVIPRCSNQPAQWSAHTAGLTLRNSVCDTRQHVTLKSSAWHVRDAGACTTCYWPLCGWGRKDCLQSHHLKRHKFSDLRLLILLSSVLAHLISRYVSRHWHGTVEIVVRVSLWILWLHCGHPEVELKWGFQKAAESTGWSPQRAILAQLTPS